MAYTDEKARLLAAIEKKYGIGITVTDDTDEAAVLRALCDIAGKRTESTFSKEDDLLRFLCGRQNPEEAKRTAASLETAFANAPAALYLICLGTPVNEDVRRILTGLCGDEAMVVQRNQKEILLLVPFTEEEAEGDLLSSATAIADTLAGDAMTMAIVIVDRIINDMTDLPASLENIEKAREIGSRLNPEERVISFHGLGIGK
ncbi:MAG: hypothetical protein IJT32_05025, partial [Lachnospiraceae bacterium]|nr:hypothetical protein [Lachnospiraceae bacterium]